MNLFRRDILKYQLRDAAVFWLLIPGALYLSGRFVDFVLRMPAIPENGLLKLTAAISIAVGLFFIFLSTRDLERYGRGTPNPRRPPKVLVRQGVYGLCRHPMFFGYDLAGLGVVLFFHSWGMLLIGYPLFLLLQILYVLREERYLARRFKNEFVQYKNETSFLIPFHLHSRKRS